MQQIHLPQKPIRCNQKHFQLEKIFKTASSRVGGIGDIEMSNGQHYKVYLHMPKAENMGDLNDLETYTFSGRLKLLRNPFKQGDSFSFYLWSRGVRYHTQQAKLTPTATHLSFLKKCRRTFIDALALPNSDTTGVFRAILLGKKENLTKKQLQHFFYTGTMHLFAVSGLHVGVVSGFIYALCRLLGLPLLIKLFATGIGVFFYATIVGFSPSTLRASLMIFFILCAQLFKRRVDVQSAFFNTLGITLLLNPFQFWDVGFQFSYGVVASILFLGIPLSTKLGHGSGFQGTLIVSFCANVMSSLFSIYYWDLFTPWSFFANLILIPMASIIVVLGITAWGIALVLPWALPIIHYLSEWFLAFMLQLVEYVEKLPGATYKISLSPCLFFTIITLFIAVIIRSLNHQPTKV